MSRNAFLRLGLGLMLVAGLNACSSSKSQNPVGSNEEVGKVEDSEDKPSVYTAREGDTLRKIAGRPEIYGDPNLWPVLQEANADSVGQSMHVNKGTKLKIPRDLSQEQMDEAREKARQHAAASKMDSGSKKPSHEMALHEEKSKAGKPGKAVAAAPVPAVNTPVPPQPVPQAKKGGMLLPVLLILLLILGALAAVLFYFMKKDGKEQNPD